MPFTGSHPAAVLPLLGVGLPASALVIGSMAPDFPYYLPGPTLSWPTHSLVGVVTVDVVLGLAVWVLWHGLISAPAVAYAPAGVRARLKATVQPGLTHRASTGRQVTLVVVALMVGSATHVLWDEFSHPHRWGTQHIPALAEQWGPLAGYHWVQNASGLIGAAAEAYWLWRWWQRTPPAPVLARRRNGFTWLGLLLIGAVAGGWAAATARSESATFAGATVGGGTMAAAATVLAVAWHVQRRADKALS